MSNNISKQYDDELLGWIDSIEFYLDALDSLGDKLGDVISRNSIVDIAAKVEVYQMMLDKIELKLNTLKKEVSDQEQLLKNDNLLIDDEMISAAIDENQKTLREKTQQSEKEYIDVKHHCNEFLSATLKK